MLNPYEFYKKFLVTGEVIDRYLKNPGKLFDELSKSINQDIDRILSDIAQRKARLHDIYIYIGFIYTPIYKAMHDKLSKKENEVLFSALFSKLAYIYPSKVFFDNCFAFCEKVAKSTTDTDGAVILRQAARALRERKDLHSVFEQQKENLSPQTLSSKDEELRKLVMG
jgi:hypothetical protein